METVKPSYEDLENRILELESALSKSHNENASSLHFPSQENLIKNIVHTTPNIFVIKDLNSVYIEVNNSFCEFLGMSEKDIIGKTDNDFFPKDEAQKYIDEDIEVISGKPHEKYEWEVMGSAGLKWLKVVKTLIYDENDSKKPLGVLCSVTDISDQKRIENSLIESEKKLIELNAMKDKFFSIIGHDLRTPISNILGFTELLLENSNNFNEEKNEKFLKIIQSSANKSFSLLNDLLEWSRSQSNKIQVYKESLNLHKIITNVIELNIHNIEAKRIRVSNLCNLELFAVSDKYIISTVIRNLISNAIKFTNLDGEIKISCSETLVNEFEKRFKIIIEDNGVGISPKILNNLFKIDKTITTKGTNGELGTGLGLILCKDFLNIIEGSINIESELGKGTRFEVSFLNSIK